MVAICQQHFELIFRYENIDNFIAISLKFVPNIQLSITIISSDNGLQANRWQAIIWHNDVVYLPASTIL